MKKFVKITALVIIFAFMISAFSGCIWRQSDIVNYNTSKEADNFNVLRRISVINARTDKPMFELVGYFSLSNNTTSELVITCQTGQNEYKKNYVYLNDWTLYVVEDLSGANVSPYHYEINYLPEMLQPFTITSNY